MLDDRKNLELDVLILASLEGEISAAEFQRLNDIIKSDEAAARYYTEFVADYAALSSPNALSGRLIRPDIADSVQDSSQESMLARKLEHDSLSAQRHAREQQRLMAERQAQEILERRMQHQQARQALWHARKRSLAAVVSVAASLAAVVLISFSLWLSGHGDMPLPVATLTDTESAGWYGGNDFQKGAVLKTGSYNLDSGYIELTFDMGAEVLIQAPADFDLLSNNSIFIKSGSMSAIVPPQARGFSVKTYGADLVDYGTEFGLMTDYSGTTQAHVFKGKVLFAVADAGQASDKTGYLVDSQAAEVKSGILTNKKFDSARFVRRIPHNQTFGIPGRRLDLVDILCGGNGFGTGKNEVSINPYIGEAKSGLRGIWTNRKDFKGGFVPVAENDFIDGVFVPDSGREKIEVSSTGLVFKECPDTGGLVWTAIQAKASEKTTKNQAFSIDGVEYGSALKPAFLLHPNLGMTFDLDNIRRAMPHVEISRFNVRCGLVDSIRNRDDLGHDPNGEVWVLVDGKVVFNKKDITLKETSFDIDVPLASESTFLTIVATDGDGLYDNDWLLFAEPCLELETKNNMMEN